jgi:hypothetical protein
LTNRIEIAGLRVAGEFFTFVADEALPGTGIDELDFWKAFAAIINDLAPKNRALLGKRDDLQARLDDWYRAHGAPTDMARYRAFLTEIGYLVTEGPDFQVTTANVDPEIAVLLIEQCASLSDADLVACARDATPAHRFLIASRRALSEVVTETLLGFGESHVIEAVLGEEQAKHRSPEDGKRSPVEIY